jgi:hypothetical protein
VGHQNLLTSPAAKTRVYACWRQSPFRDAQLEISPRS